MLQIRIFGNNESVEEGRKRIHLKPWLRGKENSLLTCERGGGKSVQNTGMTLIEAYRNQMRFNELTLVSPPRGRQHEPRLGRCKFFSELKLLFPKLANLAAPGLAPASLQSVNILATVLQDLGHDTCRTTELRHLLSSWHIKKLRGSSHELEEKETVLIKHSHVFFFLQLIHTRILVLRAIIIMKIKKILFENKYVWLDKDLNYLNIWHKSKYFYYKIRMEKKFARPRKSNYRGCSVPPELSWLLGLRWRAGIACKLIQGVRMPISIQEQRKCLVEWVEYFSILNL